MGTQNIGAYNLPVDLWLASPPLDENGILDFWSAYPGAIWPCSAEKHRIEGRDPCYVVRLPGRGWCWHTNEPATGTDQLWTVTGTPPKITVTPSINVGPEIWHGFITDGVMTPDVST